MRLRPVILTIVALLSLGSVTHAQSLYWAKIYLEQGKYLEASKELRPLAEGGNAEAQCMVGKLFYEGKGFMKSKQRAVEFLTLSANQGYDEAVTALILIELEDGNDTKAVSIARNYIGKFPQLARGETGEALAHLYMWGRGVNKDVEKAFEIMENNKRASEFREDYSEQWAEHQAAKGRAAEPQQQVRQQPAVQGNSRVFDVVEQMPSFPGGDAAMMQYLSSHLEYPAVAKENGVQGRVILTFVVERDGSISNVKVARSADPALDKEAVRVLESMPRWIPGKQNGDPVRVKYTVPVTFRL